MLAGMVYDAATPELIAELQNTREILYEFNSLHPSETQRMKEILKGLLGHTADDDFLINQPFRCDYGKQISIGDNVTIGAGSVVTRDIPSNTVAVGNPCKVIKQNPKF